MNWLRRAAVVVAGTALAVGLLGTAAPAQAFDTGWDCPGCLHINR